CSYVELGPSGTISDGCCPAGNGGDESNDVDCASTCGNGKLANAGRETCDICRIPSGASCPVFCTAGCTTATTGLCPSYLSCRAQAGATSGSCNGTTSCQPCVLSHDGSTVAGSTPAPSCQDQCIPKPTVISTRGATETQCASANNPTTPTNCWGTPPIAGP